MQYNRNQEEGIFYSEQDSAWTPTDSLVPLQVVTADCAKTWTGNYCYGLKGSIPYPVDGTFHNFVLALDMWEASVLRNINFYMNIFTAIEKMEHSNFLVATDGSAGDTD
eukprot:4824808-Ditylum_brightwellii.AAC.1